MESNLNNPAATAGYLALPLRPLGEALAAYLEAGKRLPPAARMARMAITGRVRAHFTE